MVHAVGVLYVVATPIGHLGDMNPRAVQVLSTVDMIAAEDTRHSHVLLQHFGIKTKMLSLHDHNERPRSEQLIEKIQKGTTVALITDAGTPLISDPGYHFVQAAHVAGVKVIPIPGPCALIAALCVSGLPSDRFIFEGFLAPKSNQRQQRLQLLKNETRTLVFYESPHRIVSTLEDMLTILGGDRMAALARELTKTFETVRYASLDELTKWVSAEPQQQKGEFVVLIHGVEQESVAKEGAEAERILKILLAELPVKQAVKLAADITGKKKNSLYDLALSQSATTKM